MALASPELVELAQHFGIAEEFWDWLGRPTTISEDTVVAVLAALGIDASTPEMAQQAVEEVRLRPWRRALPACTVVEQGQAIWINVHVPAGEWAEVVVRTEQGVERTGWQVENWSPDQQVDGVWTGEATFGLPDDLELGYHTAVLRMPGREVTGSLIVTPAQISLPRALGQRRAWGYATQIYSVRSDGSWGVGDLGDLADLSVWAATQQDADYVLVNPLHAAQPVARMEPSPYLPSSRAHLNPLYVRPEAIDEFASLADVDRVRIEALRQQVFVEPTVATTIDRDASWQYKVEALEIIARAPRSSARQMAFEAFRTRSGSDLRAFATWCVLFEQHGEDWHSWPEAMQDPDSDAVARFRRDHADRVEFYEWLQWVCDDQLSRAQRAARDAGMRIGVITDLAVGVHPDGADTWMSPDLFASGITVGAPPDQFNQTGQLWGQPPWRPDRLAEASYRPFRDVVVAALRHSGGVRIDHIMGLFRMWWVPDGLAPTQGCYLRYDHQALVGILLLEAHRFNAVVIGEDLGTVEPWVRDYLRERGVLGTSVLWFENDESGHPLPPQRWRELCMASVTTHDLPPTAGYLAGDHVRLRDKLGLLTEGLDAELGHSQKEQSSWLQALVDQGLLSARDAAPPESAEPDATPSTTSPAADDQDPADDGPDRVERIVLAMYRYLTLTPARLINVALTDAVGDRRTQNQPGTIDEYPNWRVPLSGPDGEPLSLEGIFASARAMRVAAAVNGWSEVPAPWADSSPGAGGARRASPAP